MRRDDLVRMAADPARTRADRLAGVEEEIRRTQAEALGRTGERLQALLDRLETLDRGLDALFGAGAEDPSSAATSDRIGIETESRNRLRDEAVRIRHHLIIQREALGLARQTPVEQCYPVPGRRSLPGRASNPEVSDPGRTP